MPIKNTLGDVHNLLMEQMERISQAGEDELEDELKRADALTGLAQQVNANATNVIKAANMKARLGGGLEMPAMLGGGVE